ncbi:hypothetical protein ACLOJK_027297 [Asimina triloba]
MEFARRKLPGEDLLPLAADRCLGLSKFHGMIAGHSSPSSGPAAHLVIDLLRTRLDDLAAVRDVDFAPRCQIGWWRWSTIARWIRRWVTAE